MKRIRRLPLGVGGILGRLGLYPLSAHSTPTWVGGDPAPRNNRALHSHRGGGVQGARPPTGKGGNAAKSRKALFAKRVGKREVSIVASVSCRHRCEGAARVKGLTGATMPDKQPAPHGQDLGGLVLDPEGRGALPGLCADAAPSQGAAVTRACGAHRIRPPSRQDPQRGLLGPGRPSGG